jgi:hypothetical protein
MLSRKDESHQWNLERLWPRLTSLSADALYIYIDGHLFMLSVKQLFQRFFINPNDQ